MTAENTVPLVRVLLRVEPLDGMGQPTGDPTWFRGLARLEEEYDASWPPPTQQVMRVLWVPDDQGVLYTTSVEEMAP